MSKTEQIQKHKKSEQVRPPPGHYPPVSGVSAPVSVSGVPGQSTSDLQRSAEEILAGVKRPTAVETNILQYANGKILR